MASPSLYVPAAVVESTPEIVGAVVSITRASLAPNEPAAPTAASVSVALFPPASFTVPPFRLMPLLKRNQDLSSFHLHQLYR